MIFMTSLISAIARTETNRRGCLDIWGAPIFVIRRIQELSRFQNHFDNMFITVPFGTLAGTAAKKENVHTAVK